MLSSSTSLNIQINFSSLILLLFTYSRQLSTVYQFGITSIILARERIENRLITTDPLPPFFSIVVWHFGQSLVLAAIQLEVSESS